MKKRILNKRFLLTSIAASTSGALLSGFVLKPLIHMWGDPPWIRQVAIVILLGVVPGVFAIALIMRLAARRRSGTKV